MKKRTIVIVIIFITLLTLINIFLLSIDIIIFGLNNYVVFILFLGAVICSLIFKTPNIIKTLGLVVCLGMVVSVIPPFYIATYSLYSRYMFPTPSANIVPVNSVYYVVFVPKGLLSCGDQIVIRNTGIIQKEYSILSSKCLRKDSLIDYGMNKNKLCLKFKNGTVYDVVSFDIDENDGNESSP